MHNSLTFLDYFFKAVGVIALATIAYHSGTLVQKVSNNVSGIEKHEVLLKSHAKQLNNHETRLVVIESK
jgi:hypothetical protein